MKKTVEHRLSFGCTESLRILRPGFVPLGTSISHRWGDATMLCRVFLLGKKNDYNES